MQTTVTRDGTELTGDEAARFRAADESLRQNYAGLDIDETVPEVRRSLHELGVAVPESIVRAYAQHIADRADFELPLP